MRQKRESNLLAKLSLTMFLVGLILNLPCISKAEDVKKDAKIKPDIIIKSAKVVYIPAYPDIEVFESCLEVHVKVYNGTKNSSTGPFFIRAIYKSPFPGGAWCFFSERRIENLVNNPKFSSIRMRLCKLRGALEPESGAGEYRFLVKVDSTNAVDEGPKGELNNEKLLIWKWRIPRPHD
jgi:hypothetical protein